jgi:hypothetical protein
LEPGNYIFSVYYSNSEGHLRFNPMRPEVEQQPLGPIYAGGLFLVLSRQSEIHTFILMGLRFSETGHEN